MFVVTYSNLQRMRAMIKSCAPGRLTTVICIRWASLRFGSRRCMFHNKIKYIWATQNQQSVRSQLEKSSWKVATVSVCCRRLTRNTGFVKSTLDFEALTAVESSTVREHQGESTAKQVVTGAGKVALRWEDVGIMPLCHSSCFRVMKRVAYFGHIDSAAFFHQMEKFRSNYCTEQHSVRCLGRLGVAE
jgi:hypothetical protein